MDKNLFLAVALSILVYAAWFGFVEKKLIKPIPAPNAAQQALSPKAPHAPDNMAPPPAPAAGGAPDWQKVVTHAKKDAGARYVGTIGNAAVQIRPAGAAIVSWKFKGPNGNEIELVKDQEPGLLSTFPELEFRQIGRPDGMMFAATRADGARVIKEFLPGGDTTVPRVKITIENPGKKPLDSGAWTLSLGPGLGTIPTEEKDNAKITRTLALEPAERGLNGKVDVFKNPGPVSTDYRWMGVDNRYFLAAVLPQSGDFDKAAALEGHQLVLTVKAKEIAAGASASWDVPFYIGAKGHTWLSRYKLGLERSIDFGFFAQLGRVVLRVLYWLHNATGNWGWSIIILTVLIQVIMFPLTFKSLKSMSAMRRLQPEIAKLQQRYSKDPTKLNTEMMALYKKHGANPLGGCLPMLVQLPIFYALYNALRNAWELHGSAWIFWIHDLSAKDPYYVLPLVMGALMYFQNKLNPAATDPTQQQMMTFMPIIFTVMFMNFPSGLVLYWLTNSLVSTLQQLALRKQLGLTPA